MAGRQYMRLFTIGYLTVYNYSTSALASIDECDNIGNTPVHYAEAEGHLPCLKFLVSTSISPTHVLGARNDLGKTPKDLIQQFYKDAIIEYINGIEGERDKPEQTERTLANDCLQMQTPSKQGCSYNEEYSNVRSTK
ncbi:hypothetical protein DPMN_142408 [Dreissena polymorpha]|uniref:Uncharacterized protein n=1 Tax=Dreissena polymorpha TaxID=45954 RepID=A0A9D4JJ54_DREPO|nr:hypothetical protein DPMN_142408 [Dreissena polymorpha]